MSSLIHDGPAVYVNADKSAVVDGSSPEAAFLMVGPGSAVKREFVALYRQHFGLDGTPAADGPEPRTVAYGGQEPAGNTEAEVSPEPEPVEEPAAVTKPRRRTAKK